ncbi:unnamed protein product [Rhizophagus irregularis]|nr:unnamed protein product [Rhizophagus irregularis]
MDTTIEDPLRMIARNILIDYSPSDLNEDFVTVNLGSINQVLNNPPTSMNKNFRHENILLNVMCNDIQLADTWSIPIKGNTHRISIAPCNLTQKQKEERKRYSARLIDVDRDIDYINVHDLLTEAKAKEWHIYDSNKQEKKSIQVFFKTGRDRDNTIRTPCIINNKNFTWIKGSMDHTDSPFGPTNATITIQIIEDRINSYKTEENIITTDKVIDKWTQDKAKEPTTQDTIQIINHDNFSEDFMDLDITELTTLVDRIKINKEDLYQIEEPNISQPIKVLETIRETSITQRSEATEEITTEDTITTTNTQMNRRNKTDTTKIGTQETMMLDTRDKTINTIEKTPKMMPTAIEEMEMDTTIDEQIMTMIEEAEITSIMDIDIESTSSILTREEEMTVCEAAEDNLTQYIKKNNNKTKTTKNQIMNNNTSKINNQIKIGCLNIRGLNDGKGTNNKQQKLKEFIEKENWDIAGINETKIKKSKGKYIYKDWINKKIRNNSAEEEKSKGSQLLIQKQWIELRTINYQVFEGYAQSIDVLLKGKKKSIRIINVYMIGNNKNRKCDITTTVDKWITNAKSKNLDIIVMGDFNERRQNTGKKGKNMFLEMLDDNNMIDIHIYFNNEEPIDTWTNGNIHTRIDYIFANNELLSRIKEHEVLNIEERLMTDHKALTITINIDNEISTRKINGNENKGTIKSNLSGKDWELIAEKVENNIDTNMTIDEEINNQKETRREIDRKWTSLKETIVNEITKKRIEIKEKKTSEKTQHTTDVKNLSYGDHVKIKLKIINELEKCIKNWDKLVKEKSNFEINMRRDLNMRVKFGDKERKVITSYKTLVHRFTDIVNAEPTIGITEGKKLYDSLDDSKKLVQTKTQLNNEKRRLNSDLENVKLQEQSLEIEKNIERREQLMTTDLKEMIIRIMDK